MPFWKKSAPATATVTTDFDLGDATQKFAGIINNIEDGVILIDRDGVIQLCNPGAATICGWPVDEAMGINVENVVTLVDDKGKPYAAADNPFINVFKSAQIIKLSNAALLNRSKQSIAISMSVTPLSNSAGELTAAVGVFRDVSDERARQQQTADFISTASHEMRTPVAAIEGYLSLALNDKVATIDNRARDYLEKAHTSTQHLGQLFQDLLTSAKAEDGRLTSHPKVIELGEFLEQLTSDLRFAAEKRGLFAEFVVGNSSTINATTAAAGDHVIRPLYYVYADPDRLREVVTNLFDNAVKYTPEGKISIGITGDTQVAQCSVKDTGPGIPAEDVPHLFQKFYRVDNSATRTIGGTGLGLFICKKIIELYNGRIWVESELGKGSNFYINLPRLTNERVTQLQTEAAAHPQLDPVSSVPSS